MGHKNVIGMLLLGFRHRGKSTNCISQAVIDISPSSNVDDLWAATFIGDDSLAFAGQVSKPVSQTSVILIIPVLGLV